MRRRRYGAIAAAGSGSTFRACRRRSRFPGSARRCTLDALPGAVSEARRWVAGVADGLLDGEQAENLRLVISEIVTNALRHGADGERIDLAVTPKQRVPLRAGHRRRPGPRAAPARARDRARTAASASSSSSSSRAAGA